MVGSTQYCGQTTNAIPKGDDGVLRQTSLTRVDEDLDDDLLDYEPSSERMGIDVNVIYLSSTDYSLIGDDEVAQFAFGPQDIVFKKPAESDNHLKSLYIRGHLNGAPISRKLVDGGAVVNVVPYTMYKKMGKSDAELIRVNMTINGVGGSEPIKAKGVASVELTVESKTMPIAFFVAEVQDNYNVIFGCDWIHANRCVSSTLHQMLI